MSIDDLRKQVRWAGLAQDNTICLPQLDHFYWIHWTQCQTMINIETDQSQWTLADNGRNFKLKQQYASGLKADAN